MHIRIGTVLAAGVSLAFTWSALAQEFSWNFVPLYAEIGKTSGDFTPGEVEFLASHFAIITVEKAQALKQRGSSEAGNKIAVVQLKAANPKLKVLVYWNAYVDYESMYKTLQQTLPESWFVPEGMGVRMEGRPWRGFDASNPDFRDWWVNAAADLVTSSGADGIFVDGIPKIAGYSRLLSRQMGPAKAQAMADGAQQMMKQLRARLGDGAIVIFNGLRSIPNGWPEGGAAFLRYTSGALVEHFVFQRNSSAEEIVSDMSLIKSAAALGKIVIVKAWPSTERSGVGERADPEKMSAEADRGLTFPLACFLLVASDRTYFSYSWGFRAEDGWFRSYDAFSRKLGPPLGPANRKGTRFERKFAHADVVADLASKTASIEWQ